MRRLAVASLPHPPLPARPRAASWTACPIPSSPSTSGCARRWRSSMASDRPPPLGSTKRWRRRRSGPSRRWKARESRRWPGASAGRPGLLLVHGGRANADWWPHIAPMLANRSPGRGALALRQRAFGMAGALLNRAVRARDDGRGARDRALRRGAAHLRGPLLRQPADVRRLRRRGRWRRGRQWWWTQPSPPPTRRTLSPRRRTRAPCRPRRKQALARFRLMPPQPCDNPFILDYIARRSLKPAPRPGGGEGWTWRFDPFGLPKLDGAERTEADAALRAVRCPLAFLYGEHSAIVRPDNLAYTRSLAPPGTPFVTMEDACPPRLPRPAAGLRGASARAARRLCMTAALRIRPPGRPLVGTVRLPGSKSITNRALLLAGMARGESRLTGALKSDDTARMAEALRAMGVQVRESGADGFEVVGDGRLRAPRRSAVPRQCGHGDALPHRRGGARGWRSGAGRRRAHAPSPPSCRWWRALGRLCVRADAPTGCPPVRVHGRGGVDGGRLEVDGRLSSQYVSAPC